MNHLTLSQLQSMASAEPYPFGITASASASASASTSYPQLSLRQPITLPSDRSHLHFRKPQHRIGTAATFYNSVSVSFATGSPTSVSAATGALPWEEKWGKGKRKLSYAFDSSFPNDNEAKQAVVRAFNEWESVSDFSFIPCDNGCPDIVIGMHSAAYTAGECYPFDKKFLGHACLPTATGGRMHFNSDQKWSYSVDGPPRGSRSFDLESVALHEIGHILGLKHSRNRDAVMYKTIKRGKMKRRLTELDIGMLESLYL